MRQPPEQLRRQPDFLCELLHTLLDITRQSQAHKRLGNCFARALARIEAVGGILKDQLDAGPFARDREAARRQGGNVTTLEDDRTLARINQARQEPRQRRFAASGFADQPD